MERSEKEPVRLTAEKKLYAMLGMAQKAGKLASGEFSTEKAVKEGHARLVVVAGDASENTKKMFRNMCAYYQVPCCSFSDKETLGERIGKEFRASLAIKDAGMAKAVCRYLEKLKIDFEGSGGIAQE